ncbi:MAG: hypothetical protein IPP07_26345 [Holophagales bacterium]|nr:hypothetical protein [Holophagales bacterium]
MTLTASALTLPETVTVALRPTDSLTGRRLLKSGDVVSSEKGIFAVAPFPALSVAVTSTWWAPSPVTGPPP